MTKAPIGLQDLRRSLYVKAKAEPPWRFWGLYVHVCKMETLWEAYRMARSNDGAPGIDGVTFEAIEESGAEGFLTQIRDELVTNTYRPKRARRKEIPKDGGTKVRVLLEKAVNTTRRGNKSTSVQYANGLAHYCTRLGKKTSKPFVFNGAGGGGRT
jgi:RNA-directed DNA polymerase